MQSLGRNRAKRTLTHYFKTLFDATGVNWDYDNAVEIESIVDEIIDAAKEEVKSELNLPVNLDKIY